MKFVFTFPRFVALANWFFFFFFFKLPWCWFLLFWNAPYLILNRWHHTGAPNTQILFWVFALFRFVIYTRNETEAFVGAFTSSFNACITAGHFLPNLRGIYSSLKLKDTSTSTLITDTHAVVSDSCGGQGLTCPQQRSMFDLAHLHQFKANVHVESPHLILDRLWSTTWQQSADPTICILIWCAQTGGVCWAAVNL